MGGQEGSGVSEAERKGKGSQIQSAGPRASDSEVRRAWSILRVVRRGALPMMALSGVYHWQIIEDQADACHWYRGRQLYSMGFAPIPDPPRYMSRK